MKKIILTLTLVLLNIVTFSQTKPSSSKVEVYYFHSTNRCKTCLAIEAATKKTLDTYFKNEMSNGTIKFFVLNVDEKNNEKIAEKYEASGAALFVTKISNGKEIKNDLTNTAFEYVKTDESKFINELKNKISESLK